MERVLAMEKPKAKVGDPPRRIPPKPPAEKPKEETLQGPPESIEELREKIAYFLPGHSELVVVSSRGDYYRVGRRRMLDEEIENHVDMVIITMGGAWDKEANCWKIPKKVKG
jgi:hypothetical protein